MKRTSFALRAGRCDKAGAEPYGVHPNTAGYAMMAPITRSASAEALAR